MSHMTNESDGRMASKDQIDSPSGKMDGSGSFSGGETVMKKGPWTRAEDDILRGYVDKYGDGNWNAVQKQTGLMRCGKSCRLRWANHLRPNLKRCPFTTEEEQLIVQLHANMGNKWAQMALHLSGRTDNEIKNFWNTRKKRLERAGVPLHPPDVACQNLNENLVNQRTSRATIGVKRHHESLHPDGCDMPDFIYDNLKPNQGTPQFAVTSMLNQGFGSCSYGFGTPFGHAKWLQETNTLLPSFIGSSIGGFPTFEQFPNGTSEKIHRPFGMGFSYVPCSGSRSLPPLGGSFLGSHALFNGNLSTSQALPGSVKVELPSLQYTESDPGNWCLCSVASPLAAQNAFVKSSHLPVCMQSGCGSPRSSGLLETIIQEGQGLAAARNQSSDKSSISSVAAASDLIESSTHEFYDPYWEAHSDLVPPLECSAAPGGSLSDKPTSGNAYGFDILKQEFATPVSNRSMEEKEVSLGFPLLECLSYESVKNQHNFSDGIGAVLGENDLDGDKLLQFGESSNFGGDSGLPSRT